jgi:hypothetical protein
MGNTGTLTIFASPIAPAAFAAALPAAPLAAAPLASQLAVAPVAALWPSSAIRMPIEVPVSIVSKSFAQVLDNLGEVFNAAAKKTLGGMRLQEVEVSLDVSAEGKVGLLGTGASITGSTGLRLTFKRNDANEFSPG